MKKNRSLCLLLAILIVLSGLSGVTPAQAATTVTTTETQASVGTAGAEEAGAEAASAETASAETASAETALNPEDLPDFVVYAGSIEEVASASEKVLSEAKEPEVILKKSSQIMSMDGAAPEGISPQEIEEILSDGLCEVTETMTAYIVEYPYQLQRLIVRAEAVTAAMSEAVTAGQNSNLTGAFGARLVVYDAERGNFLFSYDSAEEAKAGYEALTAAYGEEAVFTDRLMSISASEAEDSTIPNYSNGVSYMNLDAIAAVINVEAAQEVVVAVLDTGINTSHELFEGRLTDGYSFVTASGSYEDGNGHGTHVAGIIAMGTSANVKIMPIQVMDAYGNGSIYDMSLAFELAEEQGCDIVNYSADGWISEWDSEMDYYEEVLARVTGAGLMIFNSAGNNDSDLDNVLVNQGTDADPAYVSGFMYPATSEYVQTVGSIGGGEWSDEAQGMVWSKVLTADSNYGKDLDFAAPGYDIKSAYVGGASEYRFMDGTSMACPHVAAAAAMVKTLHPDWSSDEIKTYLISLCEDLGDEGWDEYYGWGVPVFEVLLPEETSLTLTVGESTDIPLWRVYSDYDFDNSVATLLKEEVETADWYATDETALSVTESGLVTALKIIKGEGDAPGTAMVGTDANSSASDDLVSGLAGESLVACKVTVLFGDVTDDSAYYYTPVYWAYNHDITTGRHGGAIFDPSATCTRAEIVTFLWRHAGRPEPSKELLNHNPFADISKKDYYYKAVLWAYENDITTGRREKNEDGSLNFDPSGTCTRREIVTFLWRYAGKPSPSSLESKFTDVTDSSAYYYKAALWAVEQGITTGKRATNYTTFDPLGYCTRGMAVTFIYRY